ncbi:hypothetical protein [Otariodibacter oris]|uniref:Uncharacterized protein n=1 Tax=Otariodibacter oris TaxID=1032623 RepID=A0A420XGA1_9PAST|nr:hypothetical protein [Otariodibacter oris]QGM80018.1 hypothetical protein A6A10_00650 [Otariodibacter oris]RKR71842.1 hypothetical protein DES31_1192 [Otariodibacter oris]
MAGRVFAFITPISVILAILGVNVFDLWEGDNAEYKSWTIFILTCVLIFYAFYQVYKFSNKVYPKGFAPVATFARYCTTDGKNIQYELFRNIQVKKSVMSKFEHDFLWTGSKMPEISSDMQKIEKIEDVEGEDGSSQKRVHLMLGESLTYNSCEVIHLKMDIDDSDEKSSTFLSQSVHEPIRSIHFRVDLLHAKDDYKTECAILEYIEIKKPKAQRTQIQKIPFDDITKSYSALVVHPKAGYRYILSWNRPKS